MGTPPHRRLVAYGAERVSATTCPPRHQHATAYVTVVLDGAYEQLAYAGRLRVEAGDVLVQPTFDCHLNRPITANVTLLRLAWPHDLSFGGVFRSVAVDDVIAAARHDVTEAASLLACRLEAHAPIPTRFNDWQDLFAADVRCEPRTAIFHWAKTAGVSREHLSRVFAVTYGVPPLRFSLRAAGADGVAQGRGGRVASGPRCAGLRLRRSGAHEPIGHLADRRHAQRVATRITGIQDGSRRLGYALKQECFCAPMRGGQARRRPSVGVDRAPCRSSWA